MGDRGGSLASALADRYRIGHMLGAGGMATVYLAQDMKHDRKVAIKVLRAELAAVIGAERFLAEIKTTANLQHPHILPLFDSGAAGQHGNGTFLFYVMPYVEGESLRDRLDREKQLPIADALRIAREVASALDYAHRHGVIHRDIKPENILLHDGQALVADFGIALAAIKAGSTRMTETGMSLGTPHYMSPEQAMGEREIGPPSDLYALGCVLYEMLAGEPPFTGPSAQAIVARVLTETPRSLSVQRKSIPAEVEDAVMTALEKLPADRFASAAEFMVAIEDPAARTRSGRRRTVSPVSRPMLRWAMVMMLLLLGGGLGIGYALAAGTRGPIARFGGMAAVTSEQGLEIQPAISPDGRFVAYTVVHGARTKVYVRQVSGGRPLALTADTTWSESDPSWSPDGSRVLFLSRDGVFSAPSSGGPARPEMPVTRGARVTAAALSPEGNRLAFVVADSLFVREEGKEPRGLMHAPELALCRWSPNGRLIACASGNSWYLSTGRFFGNLSPSRVLVTRVSDGNTVIVTDSTSLNQSPAWSPDGKWLIYVSDRDGPRDVYALRIAASGSAQGEPLRLTTGLGAQSISFSADGRRIAYGVLSANGNIWSLPFFPRPPATTAGAVPVTQGNQIIERPSVSDDESWVYFHSNLTGNAELYRMPLGGGELERLTHDPSDDFSPTPSPDGLEVAFHSWKYGSRDLFVMSLDGRPAQRVTSTPAQEAQANWAPDGRALAYNIFSPAGGINVIRRKADGSWEEPVQLSPMGFWPAWSRDGKRIAYTSALLGGTLLVVPSDGGSSRVLFDSSAGLPLAGQPYWSPDDRTIYFKSHDAAGLASIWSVPSEGGRPRQHVRFESSQPSFRPEWALGRSRMFFTVEDRQSDIWVMEVTRP